MWGIYVATDLNRRDQVLDFNIEESFFMFPTPMSSKPDQHPVPRQNRSGNVIRGTTSRTTEYPPGPLAAHIESAPKLVVGVPTEQPGVPCQLGRLRWNNCVAFGGNADLSACPACCLGGNTHYQPPPPANTERECRDRDIEDLREDIGWLQKRITEINIALDETRDNMRVLREATQLDMAADETHQTMKVLAETVQFHNQQVSQARADNELLHQRNQELRRLIRDAKQRQ